MVKLHHEVLFIFSVENLQPLWKNKTNKTTFIGVTDL